MTPRILSNSKKKENKTTLKINCIFKKLKTLKNMDEKNNVEETSNKPGVWTLIIGLLLLVRGGMRMANEELEIFGVIMIVIGIASIVYYFAKK